MDHNLPRGNKLIVTVINDLDSITHTIRVIDLFLEPRKLPAKTVSAVSLILEEILKNIVQYAYDDASSHEISIKVEVTEQEVYIRLEDDGKPFNPLTVPHQHYRKASPELAEKGLGMHLVRNMMNAMAYSREDNKNIFEVWIYG